ncbi:MAG TPA: alkaline phosphatase family protein [Candidatus Dormibacteraeota bacterium]|nr:alkaline phosphatase family protein [Candidatus Dormibacteraeota bacterium]
MSTMNRRRFLGVAGGAALAASFTWRLPALSAGAAGRLPGSLPFPQRPAGMLHPDLTPELANIDHIIIVMMENHSFDNYFGMLPHHVPGLAGRVDGWPQLAADGRPAAYNQDANGASYRAFPMPNACQMPDGHPTQSWDASHLSQNNGAMTGFVRASGQVAMGYWDQRILPFYYSLASNFPVCDRYFSSTLCQTYPNRVFMMAATAAGLTTTDTPPPTVTPPRGHIFQVLEGHGISWGCFYTDIPTPGLFGSSFVSAHAGKNLFGPSGSPNNTVAAFMAAVAGNSLPAVTLVEGGYRYSSEENPQDVQTGEFFVAGVINALFSVPSVWAKSLLIFTYDEGGGYYDHVPPPAAVSPGDGTHPNLKPGQPNYGDDYTLLGFRVPTVIVSPWAKPGFTSHTVYDHASILATIQRRWNLPALTQRDAHAAPLSDCLVASGAAPFATPPKLAAAPPATEQDSRNCAANPASAGAFPPAGR